MKIFPSTLFAAALSLFAVKTAGAAEFKTPGDKMFAAYFKAETDRLAARCMADIKTLKDWNERKDKYRVQMYEMLGLDPMPPRTPLKGTVTGKILHKDFEVWKVHYQSMPQLYVTGNLYVPKGLKDPAALCIEFGAFR